MSRIIMIAHQKDGVGKSKVAVNLAICFKEQLNLTPADSDLQGSLLHHARDTFFRMDVSLLIKFDQAYTAIDQIRAGEKGKP